VVLAQASKEASSRIGMKDTNAVPCTPLDGEEDNQGTVNRNVVFDSRSGGLFNVKITQEKRVLRLPNQEELSILFFLC
jgi:hypothetical protein